MNDLTQEVARLRRYVEKLERRIEALESDKDDQAEWDAWIERNKDALNESIREGREALARGDYIEGTIDELRAWILRDARQDATTE
ncbi:MAG: hypothetical protein IT548_08005 [Alphaproteobacteria bacterium]|nr:hypothetical protein [Alphaproteobacteria bacterium]